MNREILEREFPSALIRSRKGPFGQTFSYVEGAEYIRRLKEAFEGEFSFEIVQHIIRDNEVIVIGKLTAGTVTKMAFGGSSITVSREGTAREKPMTGSKREPDEMFWRSDVIVGPGARVRGETAAPLRRSGEAVDRSPANSSRRNHRSGGSTPSPPR